MGLARDICLIACASLGATLIFAVAVFIMSRAIERVVTYWSAGKHFLNYMYSQERKEFLKKQEANDEG